MQTTDRSKEPKSTAVFTMFHAGLMTGFLILILVSMWRIERLLRYIMEALS